MHDETWRVAYLACGDEVIGREVGNARNAMGGGHLTVALICALVEVLREPCPPADEAALRQARAEFERELSKLDLDALEAGGRRVSLFLWEDYRDGPRRAPDDGDA